MFTRRKTIMQKPTMEDPYDGVPPVKRVNTETAYDAMMLARNAKSTEMRPLNLTCPSLQYPSTRMSMYPVSAKLRSKPTLLEGYRFEKFSRKLNGDDSSKARSRSALLSITDRRVSANKTFTTVYPTIKVNETRSWDNTLS